jgi:hypothetical protein
MFFLPKESDGDIIDTLSQYMFTKSCLIIDEPIDEPKKQIEIETEPELPQMRPEPIMLEQNPTPNIEFISPTHQDSLFWCIYIAIHGYNDYLQVSRNYGVKELEIKQKIGNWIPSNASKMKRTNIKITKAAIQEILSELLTSVRETSFLSMIGMIAFFNINIIIVDATGKKMIEFLSNIDNELPTYVLHKDNFGKYKLQAEPLSKQQVDKMKTTIYCLESYLKPLKSISNYHVEDLCKIAKQIGIYNDNQKYKKPDLYQQIYEALLWK